MARIWEVLALGLIQEHLGRKITTDQLQRYCYEIVVEASVDKSCKEPILICQEISDATALELIVEYLLSLDSDRQDRIESVIDCHFGKPSGTLSELVHKCDISNVSRLFEELKRGTGVGF